MNGQDYDAIRDAQLRVARRRATLLLGLVAVLFATTYRMGDAAWVGFLRSFAEAAMIGGLADWFAVTALFRHPLGIPIPHTAIIPRSKDGLGRNLAAFVERNFLTSDQVVERLTAADLSGRLGSWLQQRSNAESLARTAAATLAAIAEGLDSDAIEDEIERAVIERLRSLPMAEMIGRGMESAIEDGQHGAVIAAAIRGISNAMEDNRLALRRRLGRESPWWVPSPVDDAVFARAYDAVHRLLDELAVNPAHEIRRTIDDRLADLAKRLRSDPELAAIVAHRVDDLASHPELRQWARGTWSNIAGALAEAAGDDDSDLRRRIADALQGLGKRLTTDPVLAAKIDTWVRSFAPPLAEVGRREIGGLIGTTIDRWDPADTSRRLELWMGRDLQFVRINGTVVGGLAGLVIHTIVVLAGG